MNSYVATLKISGPSVASIKDFTDSMVFHSTIDLPKPTTNLQWLLGDAHVLELRFVERANVLGYIEEVANDVLKDFAEPGVTFAFDWAEPEHEAA